MLSLWIAIIVISAMAAISGIVLGFAARRFQVDTEPLVAQLDALLPQSQCGQCGYPGCKPYAQALSEGDARINQCVPGGEAVMLKLAESLAIDPLPLEEETAPALMLPQVAFIDEHLCIGCTKCIQVCPVDAIIGTNRAMHTVVSELCTGCHLCLVPCPTDCIVLVPLPQTPSNWKWDLNTVPIQILQEEPYG